jgi:hypothetical protein
MHCSYFFACAARFPARLCLRALGTRLVSSIGFAFTKIIVLSVFVSFPPSSFAQVGNIAVNTVSYYVSGYVNDITPGSSPGSTPGSKILAGSDLKQTFGIINEENEGETFPISLKSTVAEIYESVGAKSEASVTVEAHAETGALRVDLHGYASRISSATSQLGEAWLRDVRVQARWQDTTKLTNFLDPRPGRLIHLEGVLELNGGMDIDVHGTPAFNINRLANSQVNLRLIGGRLLGGLDPLQPAPYDGIYFGEARESTSLTVDVLRPAPGLIDVDIFVKEGELFTMDILMEVRASGLARIHSYYSAFGNSFSTMFSANYGHTLRWGGITSVTDAQSGEPIEGWAITSASGFDYAHPAPVPEPATVGLSLLGLLGLACRRNRA